MNPGLTEAEKVVLVLLATAMTEFSKLPPQHPDDIREFQLSIHSAQNIIGCRVAGRVDPDIWRQAPIS